MVGLGDKKDAQSKHSTCPSNNIFFQYSNFSSHSLSLSPAIIRGALPRCASEVSFVAHLFRNHVFGGGTCTKCGVENAYEVPRDGALSTDNNFSLSLSLVACFMSNLLSKKTCNETRNQFVKIFFQAIYIWLHNVIKQKNILVISNQNNG